MRAIVVIGALCAFIPQSSSAQTWKLPQGVTVKDAGPRTYRFTVDYETADSRGDVFLRQRVTAEYTRGLPGGVVEWKNVAQADSNGPFQKRDFMEGFRYPNDLAATMKPDFFRGFPPTAVFERNLVWDTGMIESFGQNYFEKLELNQPYHIISKEDLNLHGVGTFQNRDVVLEWIGRSQRNGRDCAVIQYQAFGNPLEIVNAGINLKGSSNYWGQIWVALDTKQIEYATLYEQVVGDLKLAGKDTVQVLNVFRSGTLEPLQRRP